MNSQIFIGDVGHIRYAPRLHQFNYPFALWVIDLDELESLPLTQVNRWQPWRALAFRQQDYLKNELQAEAELKPRVIAKAQQLGATITLSSQVLFAGQIRHYGYYFSPVNFFFLYQQQQPSYLLAEVSNTPWGESHCYLIDLKDSSTEGIIQRLTDKVFHVSPFMNWLMQYQWQIIAPNLLDQSQALTVGIANILPDQQRLFEARVHLNPIGADQRAIQRFQQSFRWQPFNIMRWIYSHALKLWLKKIPFVSHPGGLKQDQPQEEAHKP